MTTDSVGTSVILKDNFRIINIISPQEASFARKFLINIVTVSFNQTHTAFAADNKTVFVYPNNFKEIGEIFADPSLIKLISRPMGCLQLFLNMSNYKNCKHIGDYINEKGYYRMIPELKREIITQHNIQSLNERAGHISLIMMKYKINADIPKKSICSSDLSNKNFNKNRNCYLLYLTAYNNLLSHFGPLTFTNLIKRVRNYPYLCKIELHPAMALEGLIRVGALLSDSQTALISIPDQFEMEMTPIKNINQKEQII